MGEGPGNGTVTGRRKRMGVRVVTAIAAVAALGTTVAVSVSGASASTAHASALLSFKAPATAPASEYAIAPKTKTPIKHLVVLFDENVSFDHYFGTYPHAANTDGTKFTAKKNTPKVNGLTPALLNHNKNQFNPERLSHSEALTCDQNHSYGPEQLAFDGGKMDKFIQNTAQDTCTGQPIEFGTPGLDMDYYDGNTVTGLWNYAQNFSMSDNNYDTNFGPSTPGALNLISGNDGGGYAAVPTTGAKTADPTSVGSLDKNGVGTIYGDLDPFYDGCSDSSDTSTNPVGVMTGKNIGNVLNTKHVTWGWFQGGFKPTSKTSAGLPVCGAEHENIAGVEDADYSPHHDPFQYYKSTANPMHLAPSSDAAIGRTDRANHQYDLSLFATALHHGNLPSVSFLKAGEYQDGHAGYSDPLDEQHFIVNTVNEIMSSKYWKSTAIIITYDDSDGWYDHQASKIVNGSHDSTVDTPMCLTKKIKLGSRSDRCGYGPRLPLVVISPWTRQNYVSSNLTDQSSIIKFIENNWLGGERIGNGSFDTIAGSLDGPGAVLDFKIKPHDGKVILSPTTGKVLPK
jgi:phospholipase C